MAKKKIYTIHGVMLEDAKPMVKEIKAAARTSRKEAGLYMALKFITTNRERMKDFKRYSQRNTLKIDRVVALLKKHERGK